MPMVACGSEWTVVDGARLHARVWDGPADAPVVLLVHGFVVSSRYLVPTAERLAPHARVEAPDLPGFGRSERPCDMPGVEGLADALAAWMEARGHDRASLLGNSLGCQVLAALAQRHPGRVESLVLVGPTTDPAARTVGAQAALLARDALREHPALPFVHVPDYLRMGPRRIAQLARITLDDAIEDRMPHVHAPTLILRGGRDTLVPHEFAARLAALAPRARLVTLPGAPHAANYSAPDDVARHAVPFLTGRPHVPPATGAATPRAGLVAGLLALSRRARPSRRA